MKENLSMLLNHANELSTLFETSPSEIRGKHLRKSEKSLVCLEVFFTPEKAKICKQWLECQKAINVLEEKFRQAKRLKDEITLLEQNKFANVNISPVLFKAKKYLDEKKDIAENKILKQFDAYFKFLRVEKYLEPGSFEKIAIEAYYKREKFELRIDEHQNRIRLAEERLVTVTRGLNLALIFSILVVTIPLCLPSAISLWMRKREILQHIATWRENLRKDEKSLQCADEGALAYQEFSSLLAGNFATDITEDEFRFMEEEYLVARKSVFLSEGTETFQLVQELQKLRQSMVYPELAEFPLEHASELIQNAAVCADRFQMLYEQKHTCEQKLSYLNNQLQKTLKGYTIPILESSLEKLKGLAEKCWPVSFLLGNLTKSEIIRHSPQFAFQLGVLSQETVVEIANRIISFQKILEPARNLFDAVSHGKLGTLSAENDSHEFAKDWKKTWIQLKNESNLIGALGVELELALSVQLPFAETTYLHNHKIVRV